ERHDHPAPGRRAEGPRGPHHPRRGPRDHPRIGRPRMKPRLTTIALAGLALTGAALAQIEPLTCLGPGATHDCRTTHQPIDALAAAHEAPRDPLATAELHLERGDALQARTELLRALTATPAEERSRLYFLLGTTEARLGNHHAAANAYASVLPPTFAS